MSTTLVPASHYVLEPRGQTARVFPSLAQSAAALAQTCPGTRDRERDHRQPGAKPHRSGAARARAPRARSPAQRNGDRHQPAIGPPGRSSTNSGRAMSDAPRRLRVIGVGSGPLSPRGRSTSQRPRRSAGDVGRWRGGDRLSECPTRRGDHRRRINVGRDRFGTEPRHRGICRRKALGPRQPPCRRGLLAATSEATDPVRIRFRSISTRRPRFPRSYAAVTNSSALRQRAGRSRRSPATDPGRTSSSTEQLES